MSSGCVMTGGRRYQFKAVICAPSVGEATRRHSWLVRAIEPDPLADAASVRCPNTPPLPFRSRRDAAARRLCLVGPVSPT